MEEANQIILDMLLQVCGGDGCKGEKGDIIDNRCMTCYQEACDYLEKKRILKKINNRIYELVIDVW